MAIALIGEYISLVNGSYEQECAISRLPCLPYNLWVNNGHLILYIGVFIFVLAIAASLVFESKTRQRLLSLVANQRYLALMVALYPIAQNIVLVLLDDVSVISFNASYYDSADLGLWGELAITPWIVVSLSSMFLAYHVLYCQRLAF